MRNKIIAASILAADFGNIKQEAAQVIKDGADWIHVDVMDGAFVPPITFGDNMVKAIKKCGDFYCDVHLMINNPEKHIETFKNAGSDRIIIHQEATAHPHRLLAMIKEGGISNGISINPGTEVSTIEGLIEICDLVLIMSVNPGWGGQSFLPVALRKIEQTRKLIDRLGLKTLIEVDGGINPKTASQCFAAGADVFVAGTSIFGERDRRAAIAALRAS